jgi:hypothetical protein
MTRHRDYASQSRAFNVMRGRKAEDVQRAVHIGRLLDAPDSQAEPIGLAWMDEFGYDTSLAFIQAGVIYPHLVRECIDAGIDADMIVATGLAQKYVDFDIGLDHIMLAVASIYKGDKA